jgi:hypothetical protein
MDLKNKKPLATPAAPAAKKPVGKKLTKGLLLTLLLAAGATKGFADEVWATIIGIDDIISSGIAKKRFFLDNHANGGPDGIPDVTLSASSDWRQTPRLVVLLREGTQVLYDDTQSKISGRATMHDLYEIITPDGKVFRIVDLFPGDKIFQKAITREAQSAGR